MHLGEEVDLALTQQESKTLDGTSKIKSIRFDPSHVVDPPEDKRKSHPMQFRDQEMQIQSKLNLIDFSDSGDDNIISTKL